jgi:hypothetical protein
LLPPSTAKLLSVAKSLQVAVPSAEMTVPSQTLTLFSPFQVNLKFRAEISKRLD